MRRVCLTEGGGECQGGQQKEGGGRRLAKHYVCMGWQYRVARGVMRNPLGEGGTGG